MNYKRKKNMLGLKIASMSVAIFFVITVLTGLLLYYTTNASTERSIANFSINIAGNIAEKMDTNAYEEFLSNQQENNQYWELRDELNDFREKSGALYVYTLNVNEDDGIELLIDGQPDGSPDASDLGENFEGIYTIDELSPVLNGKASNTDILEDSDYGDYLSALYPIENSNGDVIGILGVDTDASQIDTISNNVLKDIIPIIVPVFIIVGITAVGMLFIYILKVMKPLGAIEDIAENVAEGDLQTARAQVEKLPTNRVDEIGKLSDSFYRMITQLQEMIGQIQNNAEHVATSSEELYASATQTSDSSEYMRDIFKEVAASAESQLASTSEGVQSVEDIAQTAQQMADSAMQASEASMNTLHTAEEGSLTIQEVLDQMELINQVSGSTNQTVGRLNRYSNDIAEMLTVIKDIAEQTNLLALNAAIEAARAGEHGKGFAVVSEEIRVLADQSKGSVEQISQVVTAIQADMKEALQAVQESEIEIDAGKEVVHRAGSSFKQIVEEIKTVTNNIEEVSGASEEMAASSEEVTAVISHLEDQAKQSTSSANEVVTNTENTVQVTNEMTDASKSLSDIAQELQHMIQRFKS